MATAGARRSITTAADLLTTVHYTHLTMPAQAQAPVSGATASENHLASAIGTAVLAEGGNAIDAAIATSIAVHTTSPHHSCVGGAGFVVVRTPEGEYEVLNFRHTAPVSCASEPGLVSS